VQKDEATQENPGVCRKFTVLIFKVQSVFEEIFSGAYEPLNMWGGICLQKLEYGYPLTQCNHKK